MHVTTLLIKIIIFKIIRAQTYSYFIINNNTKLVLHVFLHFVLIKGSDRRNYKLQILLQILIDMIGFQSNCDIYSMIIILSSG